MQFAIDLEEDIVRQLRDEAIATGLSEADLLRRLVQQHFAVAGSIPPVIATPSGDAAHQTADEDPDDAGLLLPIDREALRTPLTVSDTTALFSRILGQSAETKTPRTPTPRMQQAIDQYVRMMHPEAIAPSSISANGANVTGEAE